MAFGTGTTGVISRNTSNTVSHAEKLSEVGVINDMTSYQGARETTIETYVDAASFSNEATDSQSGDTIITAHNIVETNTDYARSTITMRQTLSATTTT